MNMTFASKFFAITSTGVAYATLGRFNKLSSIVSMTGVNRRKEGSKPISAMIEECDTAFIEHIFANTNPQTLRSLSFIEHVISGNELYYNEFCRRHELHTECTFSLRQFLLSWSYGLEYELVEGPYTPSPVEQLEFRGQPLDPSTAKSIIVTPAFCIPETTQELESTRGPYANLIGARTIDPTQALRLVGLETHEASKHTKDLLRLVAWVMKVNSDSRVQGMFLNELEMRLPGISSRIDVFAPDIISGSIGHRVTPASSSMGAQSNSTSSGASFYRPSSNKCHELKRGKEDRNIFYAQIHQYILAVLRLCHPIRHAFEVHVITEHCSYLVVDRPLTSTADLPVIPLDAKAYVSIDQERIDELLEDADYRIVLHENLAAENLPAQTMLAISIAMGVARSAREREIGHDTNILTETENEYKQARMNVSLFRVLDIEETSLALFFQLALNGCLGRFTHAKGYVNRLGTMQSYGITAASNHAYRSFINALANAGRMELLVAFSAGVSLWNGSPSLDDLYTVIFGAMRRALIRFIESNRTGYICVQMHSPVMSLEWTREFLVKFSGQVRKLCYRYPNKKMGDIIQMNNRLNRRLRVLFITSADSLMASAREKLNLNMQIIPDNVAQAAVLRKHPQVIPGVGARWIHAPVRLEPNDDEAVSHEWVMGLFEEIRRAGNKYISQISKHSALSSSARSKYLQLLHILGLTDREIKAILCLGEGNGSVLAMLLHVFELALAVYNSLVKGENIPHAIMTEYIPPELICTCGIISRVTNVPYMSAVSGDLTTNLAWAEVESEFSKINNGMSILTFDVEGSTHKYDEVGSV